MNDVFSIKKSKDMPNRSRRVMPQTDGVFVVQEEVITTNIPFEPSPGKVIDQKDSDKKNNTTDTIRTLAQFIVVLLGLLIVWVVLNGVLFSGIEPVVSTQQTVQNSQQNQQLSQQQVAQLLRQVSRLLVLPSGVPQIAVVSNPAQLANQDPFFAAVAANDILLLYPDRVIIYRPQSDKIINVGPVTPQN